MLKAVTWPLAPSNVLKCVPGGGDPQKGLHFTKRSSLHGRTRFLIRVCTVGLQIGQRRLDQKVRMRKIAQVRLGALSALSLPVASPGPTTDACNVIPATGVAVGDPGEGGRNALCSQSQKTHL